jgi:MGT family glycosyltransferase
MDPYRGERRPLTWRAVATIGIVHIGWHGHLGPPNRLGGVLAAQGHRVIAWAPESFRAQIEASGAEMRPAAGPNQDRDIMDPNFKPHPGAADGRRMVSDDFVYRLAAQLGASAVVLTPRTVEELLEAGVELVVHDAMTTWGRVAAEWLGLPRLCSFPGWPPPYDIERRPAEPGLADAIRAARAEVLTRWGVDLGEERQPLNNFGDATVVFTTGKVLGQELPDDSWRLVGPLMPPLNGATAEPAVGEDDGRPLVYMAMGTAHNWRRDLFRAALDGLAGEDVRLLVSTGGRYDADDLAPVPGNATVVKRVDSRAVLERAAVHITHGGASSIHEALVAAVPMVCVPQGADQYMWADRLVALGVGELLEEPSPDRMREAVLHALSAPEPRRRAAELAEDVAGLDGQAVVAEIVESLL